MKVLCVETVPGPIVIAIRPEFILDSFQAFLMHKYPIMRTYFVDLTEEEIEKAISTSKLSADG